jgi:hypothetical protein
MPDTFFIQSNCDRCSNDLKGGRIMSWFNNDTICMECKEIENELCNLIVEQGKSKSSFEGIGHLPTKEEIEA